MTRAASAVASIVSRSGAAGTNAGAIPQCLAHRIRVSAADVRELVSRASRCTRSIGRVVNTATESVGPSDPIAMSGTRR